ncbi:uncharacterized protein B0T23DRAFT_415677 [Neurospora hispaniola]|uniref:SWIM-type domain-containing protein n=1 Tax=Neurospora hispaniola TaxID=588809 RepID=A0AAJ0I023_9PEZI|nr:hypothetical protein B0T23DRAFT_415677 [Neurospora hispaniola]
MSYAVGMKRWASPFTGGPQVIGVLPGHTPRPVAWGNGRAGNRGSWQPGLRLEARDLDGPTPRDIQHQSSSKGAPTVHKATMEAPRSTYLPNDAPWRKYNLGVLRQQCTARNLPFEGKTKRQLQERLLRYHLARLPEKPRPEPWMFRPFEPSYSRLLNRAQVKNLRLVEVRDVTGQVEDGRVRGKAFLIAQEGAPELFTVTFDNRPTCTCIEYLPLCVHIMYLLRYVLNVPEPLRWQRAFLDSEILDIFEGSHPVKALDSPERYTGFPGLCLICFKGQANHLSCLTCDIGLHIPCLFVLTSNRQTPGTHICTVCLDRHEWQNFHSRQERVERRVIEPGRAVAGVDLNPDVSSSSSDASEEDDESSSEEDSSDEDPDEGASRRSEQPNNAPRQPINQRRSPSPPILIKQERSSSPHGLPLPSSPPCRQRQQQQPASSPLRRKQPSRAAKDIGLVRQSLAAAAEAPTRTPRRSQGRTPAPAPESSQPVNVPAQSITPVPVPVIPAQALLQIQQRNSRQAVHSFETGRSQPGANSASQALSSAVNRPQNPAIRASATRARASAASVQEPVAPATSAVPQTVEAPVPPPHVPAPSPDVPAGSPAPSPTPASASASVSGNIEKRKATKLARKLKSLARESAYVREHADRELKRLAKKSKRLEKKAKALAKRNKASGEK